jgi:cytochrome c oxidase cbb3-type subunit I
MTQASNMIAAVRPSTSDALVERAELSEIDLSTRGPALLFFGAAMAWLFLGTILGLIASIKMHTPFFLGDYEWLTFGRSRTAHLNMVIYGWSTNVAFAVAFWIMARLCRVTLQHSGILYLAAIFWNVGVLIGTVGILGGDSQSVEWLEFPPYATPILFIAYALMGVWGVITFRFRRSEHIYVSQYYLLAAFFWFPWIYSVAQIMLIFEPSRGTVQALVNWWYAHNVLGLWFTPVGLAAAYYFIPKVLGKPIHSYYLSLLGFWSLALFYNWAGVHHLIGGPVPAWVISAGIVASVMMVIPVVVTAINHHMTVVGSFKRVWASPTLRFVVFGAISYTLVSLQGSSMALRSKNEIVHFTHYIVAHSHFGMYAFFTMLMFGSMYYIVPRLVRKEWPSAFLISIHFWTTSLGIIIYVTALSIGGLIQGLELTNPDIPFMDTVRGTLPWLFSRTLAGILITVGQIAFIVSFVWILLKRRTDAETSPTLFETPPDIQHRSS